MHDAAKNAVKSSYMTDELDIALAGLRLAKVEALTSEAQWWHFGSATERDAREISGLSKSCFEELFEANGAATLANMLHEVEHILRFTAEMRRTENTGLPALLLPQISHELLDTLMRLAQRGKGALAEHGPTLRAFALYWMFHVTNEDKASKLLFQQTRSDDWTLSAHSLKLISNRFVAEGWPTRFQTTPKT